MGMAETAQLAVRIDLEGNAAAGIGKLERQLGGLGKSASRVGKGIGQIGAGIARAGVVVGAAAATGLAAAAKAFVDYEDAFAGVVKTVDEADLKSAGLTFDDLSRSIREMSLEMPNSAIELAGIAEQAGALGVKAKDIESFTRQVAILASTTDVSAEDAATSLGQLSNVLGLTGEDYDNFAAALVDLGNKGASTESQILEITKRAGGAANSAGIAKDAIEGWASAAASLGLQQELAGTSLQRFFFKTQSIVADGGGGLLEMARIAGEVTPAAFEKMGAAAKKSLGKDFKKAFKEDASGAIETFVRGLSNMPKDARLQAVQKLFGKGTGLTRLIIGLSDAIDSQSGGLTQSLDVSAEAWKNATAAQEEFEKRNATIRSALSRLKNGLIDAAVELGAGFAPAIGRAAIKLAEFLRQDGNRSKLKALGEDIGKAIDKIDWDAVLRGAESFVGVLKTSLDITLRVLEALNKLPTELKAAAAGFLVLNKLSGGLIGTGLGNIAGGIGETITRSLGSKLPGVGKLFAQPVYVTNWPLGFGAGGGGGAGGAVGKAAAAAGAGIAVGTGAALTAIVAAVATTLITTNAFGEKNTALGDKGLNAAEIAALRYYQSDEAAQQQALKHLGKAPSKADWLSAIAKLNTERKPVTNAPGGPDREGRVAGGAGKASDGEIKKTTAAVKELQRKNELLIAGIKHVREAQAETRKVTADKLGDVESGVSKATRAAAETRRAASTGLANVRATTASGSASIVSAIYANRPVITTNVSVSATTVNRSSTVIQRYGSTGGSRNTNHAPGTGPLE